MREREQERQLEKEKEKEKEKQRDNQKQERLKKIEERQKERQRQREQEQSQKEEKEEKEKKEETIEEFKFTADDLKNLDIDINNQASQVFSKLRTISMIGQEPNQGLDMSMMDIYKELGDIKHMV